MQQNAMLIAHCSLLIAHCSLLIAHLTPSRSSRMHAHMTPVSSLLVPWATYTDPEVAHVGEYEMDLKARQVEYDTYTKHLKDNDRAIVESSTNG
eukprot:1338510-Amorphochlora_amoeboformis.AAC.1